MLNTWAGHVEKNRQFKNWQREQMRKRWSQGFRDEEDGNCDGDCIESNLERVGEECKKGQIEGIGDC